MIKLLKYMKHHWIMAILGGLLKFIEAVLELIFPLIMALIMDNGILANNPEYIIRFSFVLIIMSIIGTIVTAFGQFFAAKAAHGFGNNVRNTLYSHINHLSLKELNQFDSASLTNRVNNDTFLAEQGVALFIRLVLRCPIIAIGAIILAFNLDIPLTLILVTLLPIITTLVFVIIGKSIKLQIEAQKSLDNVSKSVKENMSGLRVIKSLNKTDYEIDEFLSDNKSWGNLGIKATKITGSLTLYSNLLLHIGISVTIFLGARRIYDGAISPGDLVAFITYVNLLVAALLAFMHLAASFSKGIAASKRINEVLEVVPSIDYGNLSEVLEKSNEPLLEINNIEFSYKKKISLKIDQKIQIYHGQSLGVIGSTGSSKTTFAKLLMRFIEHDTGEIKLNGFNINEYTSESLRNQISIVIQNGSLLNKSIKDNVNMNNNLSDEQIIEVLKVSQAYDFVKEKPEFLDYKINEETMNLSGGQKQRLVIARALASKPSVLILDDSFSALDYQTDYNLRHSLKANYPLMSKIIISQRINTIKDCEQILVLEHGRLVGLGHHEELLKTCSIYQEIYASQTKEAVINEN